MHNDESNRKQINRNLAKCIITACRVKNISCTQVASKSGLGKNYITNLNNGTLEGIPKAETLNAIAKTLQIDPEILLSKAGYNIDRYYKPVLGEVILESASNKGLSNNLANSLADVVNAVMNSKQQELVARKWFEDIISCYVYDQAHSEKLTIKEKNFYAGLGIELINYSRKKDFNIEDIEILN